MVGEKLMWPPLSSGPASSGLAARPTRSSRLLRWAEYADDDDDDDGLDDGGGGQKVPFVASSARAAAGSAAR